MAGLDPSLQLKIHEHGATTIDAALKIATQCERAQLAMTATSPATLMSIAASPKTGSSPPQIPGMAELSAAIQDIKVELRDIKRHQSGHSGGVLDELTHQVANLQSQVSGTATQPPRHTYEDSRGRSVIRERPRLSHSRGHSPSLRTSPPRRAPSWEGRGSPPGASGGYRCCGNMLKDIDSRQAHGYSLDGQRHPRSDSPSRYHSERFRGYREENGSRRHREDRRHDASSPRRVRFYDSEHQHPDYRSNSPGNDY